MEFFSRFFHQHTELNAALEKINMEAEVRRKIIHKQNETS